MRRARPACLIALLSAALACAQDRARLTISAELAPPLDRCMLTLAVREGTRTWRADACRFVAEQTPGTARSPAWATSTAGTVAVAFVLADSAAGWTVAGEVTLPLRPDWEWAVQFVNVTANPATHCFGCAGSRGFGLPAAVQAAGRDSLWVVWAGNSITHPVVY